MKRIYFFILLFFSVETSVFSMEKNYSLNIVSGGTRDTSGSVSVFVGVPFSLELMDGNKKIANNNFFVSPPEENPDFITILNQDNKILRANTPGEQTLYVSDGKFIKSFKIHVLAESAVASLQVKDLIFKNDRECVPFVVQANFVNSTPIAITNPELFAIDSQLLFLKEDDNNNLSLCVKSHSADLEVEHVTLSLKNSPNIQAKFNVAFLQGAEIKLSYEGEIKDNNYTGVKFSLNFLNFPSWGVCRDIKEIGMQTRLPGENEIRPGTTTLQTKLGDINANRFVSFSCRLDFGEIQGDYVLMSFQPPRPDGLSKEDFEQLTKGISTSLQVSFKQTEWSRRDNNNAMEDIGHIGLILNPIWHLFFDVDRYYSFTSGALHVTTSQQALAVLEKNQLTFDPAKSIQLFCNHEIPIDFTGHDISKPAAYSQNTENRGYFEGNTDSGYQIQLRNFETTYHGKDSFCAYSRKNEDRDGTPVKGFSPKRKRHVHDYYAPFTLWTDIFLINTLVNSTTGMAYNFVAKFHALIGAYSLSGANYSASPVPLTQDDIAYLESNNIRVDYLIGSN